MEMKLVSASPREVKRANGRQPTILRGSLAGTPGGQEAGRQLYFLVRARESQSPAEFIRTALRYQAMRRTSHPPHRTRSERL